MATTGHCTYEYNPTEQYQHRELGVHCGRTTYAGFEVVQVPTLVNGEVVVTDQVRERDQPDPWCPKHGGTKNPRPPAQNVAASDVPETETVS